MSTPPNQLPPFNPSVLPPPDAFPTPQGDGPSIRPYDPTKDHDVLLPDPENPAPPDDAPTRDDMEPRGTEPPIMPPNIEMPIGQQAPDSDGGATVASNDARSDITSDGDGGNASSGDAGGGDSSGRGDSGREDGGGSGG